MSSQGSILARVYTSDAYLPLKNATVTITQTEDSQEWQLLAVRVTDQSGLTEPVWVKTPDRSESLQPGVLLQPYATVNLLVEYPGYNSLLLEGIQIFPGIETIQGLQLLPISGQKENWNPIIYDFPAQPLQ